MSNQFSVLIIGAGNIASPVNSSDISEIKTHAQAIHHLADKFNLIGFIDPDAEKLKTAMSVWNVPGHAHFEDFEKELKVVDIIVIASPDHLHLEHLKKALSSKAKAIIVEKPLSNDLSKLEDVMLELKSSKKKIFINYSRRYAKIFQTLHGEVNSNQFGLFLHGKGTYAKGLFHSGSHLINLIYTFFKSDLKQIQSIHLRNDYKNDATVDSLLRFEDGSYFLLSSVDSSYYETFEIDLYFEKARILIDDLGFRITYDFPQSLNKNSKIKYLGFDKKIVNTSFKESFLNLYENVFETLHGNQSIVCDIEDSYNTIKWCHQISRDEI